MAGYIGSKAVILSTTGADISGNVVLSGTVDGRDVSVDGTKLDGIDTAAKDDQTAAEILTAVKTVDGAASGLDADLLDGQHGAYYTAYADTAVTNLVDNSPAALNTLNELAAALGDDASFSTTVTNSIAAKLPLAGGAVTGNVTFGDGNKAIFGAGSDLQIYHDGSHSYIEDAGTGSIKIKVGDFRVENASGNNLIKGVGDVATLHHAGSAKLATTATGIDVTGGLELVTTASTAKPNALRISNAGNLAYYWDMWRDNTTGFLNVGSTSGGGPTTHMTINDGNGNVGIGGVPNKLLHVRDDDSFSGGSRIVAAFTPSISNTQDAGIAFGAYSPDDYWKQGIFWERTGSYGIGNLHFANRGTADATTVSKSDAKMTINSSGKVGIGVTDPDATLDISRGSNALGALRVTQRASGAAAYGLDVGLDPTSGDPVFSRIVNDTVSESFRIQRSSGSVKFSGGIRPNETRAGVHILDSAYSSWDPNINHNRAALRVETFYLGNNSHSRAVGDYGGGIAFNHLGGHSEEHGDNLHAWVGLQVASTLGNELSHLVFATNNTTSSGGHDAGCTARMIVKADGGVDVTGGKFSVTRNQSSDFVAKFINGNGGGYGIQSDNNAGNHIFFYRGGAGVGTITDNGTTIAFNTVSDYRLKTDVQPMTGASARVQALNPVNFEWISAGTRTDGFLAHEAQAVVPEAVTGTKDAMRDEEYEVTPAGIDENGTTTTEAVMGTRSVPDHQGIDQSKIVPLLTAALREALTKIDDMETRLAALEDV
jgi:hypothetical protein